MRFKLSFLIIIILLFSCKTENNGSTPRMEIVTDLNEKFEVKLQENWNKEFITTEFSSGVISSDTTGELRNTIIININWNQDIVNINPDLEKTIDSLNTTVGLKTKMIKSGKTGEYRTSFNFSCGYDSIEKMQRNQYLYILKDDSIKGHILMTATIFGDSISTEQSELVENIMKTIKMNK